jgi:hypothetical protein
MENYLASDLIIDIPSSIPEFSYQEVLRQYEFCRSFTNFSLAKHPEQYEGYSRPRKPRENTLPMDLAKTTYISAHLPVSMS